MTTKRLFLLMLILSACTSSALAATVTSLSSGGVWSAGTTWVGGNTPAEGDDVIIAGPVVLNSSKTCENLTIETLGSVKNGSGLAYLIVNGDVHNQGTISNGTWYVLYLKVSGNLHNAGTWTNHTTYLAGYEARYISQESDHPFATRVSYFSGAGNDLIATTEVEINDLNLTDGQLVLQPGAHLTLAGGAFRGSLQANGNEVRCIPIGTFIDCNVEDAVLTGNARAGLNVTFNNRLTVMGTLLNSSGGGTVTVDGDLVNHGLIDWQHSSFQGFFVYGGLENYGTIGIPILQLHGAEAIHHLSMSEDSTIDSFIALPEFQGATVIADTPVHFSSTLGLGDGTLVLEPGSSLTFFNNNGLGSGTVMANGNEISSTGTGILSNVTVDQGVLGGQMRVVGECFFTNGLMVEGSLLGSTTSTSEMTVDGLLNNNGLISGGSNPLDITARGDIQNTGTISNVIVTVAGYSDQFIGIGSAMDVDQFIIESEIQAASYQWYKDGLVLDGETGHSISFSSVGAAMFGQYYCVADGQTTRSVFVDETSGTSGVPGLAGLASLEQNYPNPFNPRTEISFSLEQAGEVSLVVYDLGGREVQQLVQGSLAAGRHSVTWQPRDIASGTYFYGLKAGGKTMVKKCVLLK